MIKNIIRSYALLQWWISVVTKLGHLCDVKLTRNHFTQAKKKGALFACQCHLNWYASIAMTIWNPSHLLMKSLLIYALSTKLVTYFTEFFSIQQNFIDFPQSMK